MLTPVILPAHTFLSSAEEMVRTPISLSPGRFRRGIPCSKSGKRFQSDDRGFIIETRKTE